MTVYIRKAKFSQALKDKDNHNFYRDIRKRPHSQETYAIGITTNELHISTEF